MISTPRIGCWQACARIPTTSVFAYGPKSKPHSRIGVVVSEATIITTGDQAELALLQDDLARDLSASGTAYWIFLLDGENHVMAGETFTAADDTIAVSLGSKVCEACSVVAMGFEV
jgi:hypothetical protein